MRWIMDIEVFKGSVDVIILCILSTRTSYGYEISKLIKEGSDNIYEIGEGTLYLSLKRLESKKMITSSWQLKDDRNRKYYSITELGREYLQEKITAIKNINNLFNKLLEVKHE